MNRVNSAGHDWLVMRKWIIEYLSHARDALEHFQPEGSTQIIRGEIKALRAMLSFVEPETDPTVEIVNYEH